MVILYWCLVVVMVAGIVGAFLPGIPGTSLIVAAIVGWGLATHDFPVLAWPIGCAVVVFLFGFVIDFLAGYLGAKQVGASNSGQIGAVVGMVAGFFGLIPALPVGGPLLGSLGHWDDAQRSSLGLAVWASKADRKSTRLNSSHVSQSRMPSSA